VVDPPLKTWIDSKSDLVTIEYHTSFPYIGDPFYQANIAEQDERLNYAEVFRTPTIRFDGPHQPTTNTTTAYETLYAERRAVAARASIELSGSFDPQTQTGIATATITTEQALAGDWRLRMVVVQNDIDYPAPNGIDEHHHVFRSFLPDPTGTAVDLATGGESLVVTQPFAIDPAWQMTDFAVVAFLQDDLTRTIEQGAQLRIDDLTPVEATTWGAVKAAFR